jgi:hypothetical protein
MGERGAAVTTGHALGARRRHQNARHQADPSAGTLMSVPDAARALGVGLTMIKRAVDAGALQATRGVAGVAAIRPRAISRWLADGVALSTALDPAPEWQPVVQLARDQLRRRLISTRDLTTALSVHPIWPNWHTRRNGFPLPTLRLYKYGGDWYERRAVAVWCDAHPAFWTTALRGEIGR